MSSRLIFIGLYFFMIPVIGKGQLNNDEVVKKYKAELITIDSLFNVRCQSDGLGKAFIDFSADNVILMRQNQIPIIGKEALVTRYANINTESKLSWLPVTADVSVSGDLGYTFGSWTLSGKTASGIDTTSYGVYISIWKRQKDNSWKYVFDGGNETPTLLPWNKK
jgi:ketosteroid isomerase-like protein